jgi:hypothetical protein
MNREVFKESSKLSNSILVDIIEPSYYADTKELIENRKCWRITGSIFTTISKVFLGVSSIFAFASGTYNNVNWSFISGCISIVSLVSLQFATHAYKESKENTEDLNMILNKLNISNIPDLVDNNIKKNEIDEQKLNINDVKQ